MLHCSVVCCDVLCCRLHVLLRYMVSVQAPVDVMGVVTAVGPMGTIKRKMDSSELMRRDITLADSRSAAG